MNQNPKKERAKGMLKAILKAVRSAVDENVAKNWKTLDSQTRYRVLNEIFQRAKIIMKVDRGGPSNSTFGSYCTAIRNSVLFQVDLETARKHRRDQFMYAWEWAREHTTAADGNQGDRIKMAFDDISKNPVDHPDFPQPRKRPTGRSTRPATSSSEETASTESSSTT